MSGVSQVDGQRPGSSGGIRPGSPGTGSAMHNQNVKKQRMRSSSPAVQTTHHQGQQSYIKAKPPNNPNQSFTGGSKVTNMSQLNKSLVP